MINEQLAQRKVASVRLKKSYVGKIKHLPKWQRCWFFGKSCQPSGTTKRTTNLLPRKATNNRDNKRSGKKRCPLCAGLSGRRDHTPDFPEIVLRRSVEARWPTISPATRARQQADRKRASAGTAGVFRNRGLLAISVEDRPHAC